jgi:hypothetical protein
VVNWGQDDTDGDDCGNLCDADYNNDGIVGFPDFGIFLGLCFPPIHLPRTHPLRGRVSRRTDPGLQVRLPGLRFLCGEVSPRAGPVGHDPRDDSLPIAVDWRKAALWESGNPSAREQRQREREHGENQFFYRVSENPSSEPKQRRIESKAGRSDTQALYRGNRVAA